MCKSGNPANVNFKPQIISKLLRLQRWFYLEFSVCSNFKVHYIVFETYNWWQISNEGEALCCVRGAKGEWFFSFIYTVTVYWYILYFVFYFKQIYNWWQISWTSFKLAVICVHGSDGLDLKYILFVSLSYYDNIFLFFIQYILYFWQIINGRICKCSALFASFRVWAKPEVPM